MAQITAAMVAELRSKTGAGMMDCKKALAEADGNLEAAVDILRKKGLSAAAKKAGRVAAEGLVEAAGDGSRGALVEVNAETDFVAKNENFQKFVAGVAATVLEQAPADLDALMQAPFPGTGRSVAEEQTHQIATIGENISVRRFVRLEVEPGIVSSYIHAGGKIGVLVEIATDRPDAQPLQELAKQVAMHVAAANPQYLTRDEVPAEVLAKEKEIMAEKAKASGKPDHIVDKIVEGQLNKFFGEVCLVEQAFVIDPDLKVEQALKKAAKEAGGSASLQAFARFQLGEGVEKKQDDFASEVASLTK